jgi:hypothetical protein
MVKNKKYVTTAPGNGIHLRATWRSSTETEAKRANHAKHAMIAVKMRFIVFDRRLIIRPVFQTEE